MICYLERLGYEWQKQYPEEKLVVGDLTRADGWNLSRTNPTKSYIYDWEINHDKGISANVKTNNTQNDLFLGSGKMLFLRSVKIILMKMLVIGQ